MPATKELTRAELRDLLRLLFTDALNLQITPAVQRQFQSAVIDSLFNKAEDTIQAKNVAGLQATLTDLIAKSKLAHYQNTDAGTTSDTFTLGRAQNITQGGEVYRGLVFAKKQGTGFGFFGARVQNASSEPVFDLVQCLDYTPDSPANSYVPIGSAGLPAQTGQNGKVLKTDGVAPYWATDLQGNGSTGSTGYPYRGLYTPGTVNGQDLFTDSLYTVGSQLWLSTTDKLAHKLAPVTGAGWALQLDTLAPAQLDNRIRYVVAQNYPANIYTLPGKRYVRWQFRGNWRQTGVQNGVNTETSSLTKLYDASGTYIGEYQSQANLNAGIAALTPAQREGFTVEYLQLGLDQTKPASVRFLWSNLDTTVATGAHIPDKSGPFSYEEILGTRLEGHEILLNGTALTQRPKIDFRGAVEVANEGEMTVVNVVGGSGTGSITDGSITNNKLATAIKIGSLTDLTFSLKTSVVGALNWLYGLYADLEADLGDPSALTTNNKTSVVAALNEVKGAAAPATTVTALDTRVGTAEAKITALQALPDLTLHPTYFQNAGTVEDPVASPIMAAFAQGLNLNFPIVAGSLGSGIPARNLVSAADAFAYLLTSGTSAPPASSAPAPPTGVTFTSANNGTQSVARLAWAAVSGTGITYEVRFNDGPVAGETSGLVYDFTGFTPGVAYTADVRSKNASGVSVWVHAVLNPYQAV